MKGISPLVAAILLIAFTVAIGGIISIWLTGFARQQTAQVSSATQCAVARLDVKVSKITPPNPPTYNNTIINVTLTNYGPERLKIAGHAVICNGVQLTNTTSLPDIMEVGDVASVGFENKTGAVDCPEDKTKLSVRITALCGPEYKSVVVGECESIYC